jgi:hypothetical protein
MHLTSRASRDECDFEAEEFEFGGVDYYICGVITIPERLDDEGIPVPKAGSESIEITLIETYSESVQDWVLDPAAMLRLKDDKLLHAALIEEFWDTCQSNEEARYEAMQERR